VETKVCVRRFEVVEWRKFKDELIECGPSGGERTIRFKRSFLLGARVCGPALQKAGGIA
jgi:hypothetical protein